MLWVLFPLSAIIFLSQYSVQTVESCGHSVDRSGLRQLKGSTDLAVRILEILK